MKWIYLNSFFLYQLDKVTEVDISKLLFLYQLDKVTEVDISKLLFLYQPRARCAQLTTMPVGTAQSVCPWPGDVTESQTVHTVMMKRTARVSGYFNSNLNLVTIIVKCVRELIQWIP